MRSMRGEEVLLRRKAMRKRREVEGCLSG